MNIEELSKDELYQYISKHPGHLLRRAYQIFLFFFDEAMEGYDMTPLLWILLSVTYCFPGRSVTSLAELSRIDRASCGRAATVLEKRGLMQIRKGDKDHRERLLNLTSDGREFVRKGLTRGPIMQDRILEYFSQKEAKEFVSLLEIFVERNRKRTRLMKE